MRTTRLDPLRLERDVATHEVDVAAARVMQHAELLYQQGRIRRAKGLAMSQVTGSATTVNCAGVFERRDCKKVLIDGSAGGVVRITPGQLAACVGPQPEWDDDASPLDPYAEPDTETASTADSVEDVVECVAANTLALNTFDLSAYFAPGYFGPYAGSSTRIWRLGGYSTFSTSVGLAEGTIDAAGTLQISTTSYPKTFAGFGGNVTTTFTWGTKVLTIFADTLVRTWKLQRGYNNGSNNYPS